MGGATCFRDRSGPRSGRKPGGHDPSCIGTYGVPVSRRVGVLPGGHQWRDSVRLGQRVGDGSERSDDYRLLSREGSHPSPASGLRRGVPTDPDLVTLTSQLVHDEEERPRQGIWDTEENRKAAPLDHQPVVPARRVSHAALEDDATQAAS